MHLPESLLQLLRDPPHSPPLNYGTAGFRAHASALPSAFVRCGILAAARSHSHAGAPIGAMITASHNPAPDNGLKLVEPDGSMLSAQWEPVATQFVNHSGGDPLQCLASVVDLQQLVDQERALVLLGRDTRETSPHLAQMFTKGVSAVGGTVVDLNLVTTPQLHFAVDHWRQHGSWDIDFYYDTLSHALRSLVDADSVNTPLVSHLVVDCANGVGSIPMKAIKHLIPNVTVINANHTHPLNHQCGADYVQKKRQMPAVYDSNAPKPDQSVWASLDGDADRLVLFRQSENENKLQLADGDRFAALVTSFITKHLALANVETLSVAVAQTAYSNGAATEFLSSLDRVEVVIAKTGVKHLEKAVTPFDVGIYWEPNGHGTVLFSKNARDILHQAFDSIKDDTSQLDQIKSLRALLAVSKLANQTVGDGVADLLLVIGILSFADMTFEDWLNLYDERCSSNMVVHVSDKSLIVTADCDRELVEPTKLREAIARIAGADGCRAFVRPSGTEDVVRVYAEAPVSCDGQAHEMALEISRAVYDTCGGVGDRP